LERAASTAHHMVCNWGMSDKIGPIYLAANQGEVFLGRDLMQRKHISQVAASQIDQEVNQIVNDAYQKAKTLLTEHLDALHKITKTLLEDETIDGSVILEILQEQPQA